MKEIYELKGQGYSAREIARELGLARNTVLRYMKDPETMRARPRPMRGSKLDPQAGYIDRRISEGLENCRVLLREIRGLGYKATGRHFLLSSINRWTRWSAVLRMCTNRLPWEVPDDHPGACPSASGNAGSQASR